MAKKVNAALKLQEIENVVAQNKLAAAVLKQMITNPDDPMISPHVMGAIDIVQTSKIQAKVAQNLVLLVGEETATQLVNENIENKAFKVQLLKEI